MLSSRKTWPTVTLLALAMLIPLKAASATAISFTVHAGEEGSRTLDLAVDDHVFVRFSVAGGQSGNRVGTRLVCPNGTEVAFGDVSDYEYRFICSKQGQYILYFKNSGANDLLLGLEYEVEHYIMGLPQMLFLALIVVALCVAAVAVFIFMGKPH